MTLAMERVLSLVINSFIQQMFIDIKFYGSPEKGMISVTEVRLGKRLV